MRPMPWLAAAIMSLAVAVPAGVAAAPEEPDEKTDYAWGGEIRFHGGALNSDDGFGRTGGLLETRLFMDFRMPSRLRFFGEVGSGSEQGTDDPGLERLYLEYAMPKARDLQVTAGWFRLPFGRWDAFTLSRPLIKDRQFFHETDASFQLRRTSAGLGARWAHGPLEMDLAFVNRAPTSELRLSEGSSREAVGRVGLRHAGLSAGASFLKGLGSDPVDLPGGPVDMAAVSCYGVDFELSRGAFTFGGEGVLVDIDGRTSRGYYIQGAWDLSMLARGLRILGKYDVMREAARATTDSFRRATLGARYSLRRDLDVDFEVDRDFASRRVAGFGGTHVIVGLRYRF